MHASEREKKRGEGRRGEGKREKREGGVEGALLESGRKFEYEIHGAGEMACSTITRID